MLTFAIIKSFFSHWVGACVLLIVLACGSVALVEHIRADGLSTDLATANTKIGSLENSLAGSVEAASDCSAGTQAAADASNQASSEAQVAVTESQVKAKMFIKHGDTILSTKPTGTDDYTNSKNLMNQLIDDRTTQNSGAVK